MIQRVQSLYLLITTISTLAWFAFVPVWNDVEGVFYGKDFTATLVLGGLSMILSLTAIFLYKTRLKQFVLGRINILINFLTVGFFVYWTLILPGEMRVSEKGIGIFLPIISIVFLALANKAIKKDEDLVKSADRFR
jgi:hypothetical protein